MTNLAFLRNYLDDSLGILITSAYLMIIICSRMQFVAIILVLSVFFMQFFAWPIFRLTHLTFRPQKGAKQVVPSGHNVLVEPFSSLVFKYAIHRICFGDLYLCCEGRFLEIDPPPPVALPHCCHPISSPVHPPLRSLSFN